MEGEQEENAIYARIEIKSDIEWYRAKQVAELIRVQYYLMSVPYSKGLMVEAIGMHEGRLGYYVEESYQAILDS